MRAITIWQPWATLIMIGAKRFETRGWRPGQLGPLWIHAAAKRSPGSLTLCFQEPFRSALLAAGINKIGDLPFGAILGQAELVACHQTEVLRQTLIGRGQPGLNELALGDYRDGRFAWELVRAQPLKTPIKASGQQGWWNWEQS